MKSPPPPSPGDIDARIVIGCQVLRAATPDGEQRSLEEIAWVCGVSVSTIGRIYRDGLAMRSQKDAERDARVDSHGRSLDNISARLDGHRSIIDHNAIDGEERLIKLEADSNRLQMAQVYTTELCASMAREKYKDYPASPPPQQLTTENCANDWAVWILYFLFIVDILIHLFK